ncbi:hypothetical protein [Streptomyces rubradiris]|nr:hypothetical protein [Streptomyces rubradiris]
MSVLTQENMPVFIEQPVEKLAASVHSSEALNNEFCSRWKGGPLTCVECVKNLEIREAPTLDTTRVFSSGQRALCESEDQRVGQGALPAQEPLACSMLTRRYEGVRNYKSVYERDDDFHKACEYFYVHIKEAEKEHEVQAVKSAAA